MSNLNKVQLIGRLGSDPEVRYMPSGDAMCNFTLATSESWKDKNSGEKKEKTEWHRISCFGKLAEIAGQYLVKGSLAYVEGQLTTREWTDKEGVKRYTTEIKMQTMQMLSPKSENHGGGQAQRPAASKGRPQQSDSFEDDLDIPF